MLPILISVAVTPGVSPRTAWPNARPGDAIAACALGDVELGPGCARVEDDRITVRAPDEALLWAIAGEGLDLVTAVEAGASFVVAPFTPERSVRLEVGTLDVSGGERRATFVATMAPPRPHLVLNEALADPLGAEPAQEWVEIVNDGLAPGTLAGCSFGDSGGVVPLPDVPVAPGELVLLVSDGFVADDGVDVQPVQGVRLVRLAHLGSAGLKNSGEELRLVASDGRTLSRIPAQPAPQPGRSQARSRPAAPDEPSSFVLAAPTPGRENGL